MRLLIELMAKILRFEFFDCFFFSLCLFFNLGSTVLFAECYQFGRFRFSYSFMAVPAERKITRDEEILGGWGTKSRQNQYE